MEWGFVGRANDMEALAAAVEAGRSVLLTGAAGVGKSRLAEEFAATLGRGRHTERLIGSPSIRELPFGGVAHLMGDTPVPESSMLITLVGRALHKRASGKPVVVVVDDIDQLDDGSIAVVHHLLREQAALVVATTRDAGAGEARVLPLWKDGLLDRIDLEPLSRDETEALTTDIIGNPGTAELHNQVWRLTEGHPLFIRELLLEAMERGATSDSDGLVRLIHPLGASRRVSDMIRQRSAHLQDAELAGLRSVALCEPVSLRLARDLVGRSELASLEAKQMIRVEHTTTGPVVRTAHPLLAEVTVGQLPVLGRAEITSRLARALLETPSLSPRDAMRAALWLLDAGETPPHEVAVQGARSALMSFDPVLARRLAESALSAGAGQDALVLLGRAHAGAGNAAEAIAVLQRARKESRTESELAAAMVALAEVHMFNLGDAAGAVSTLREVLASMTEAGPRAELNSHLMLAVGIIGDFDLGMRIGPDVVDRIDLPEPAQLTSVMAMTLAQTMTGKLDGVIARLDRGDTLAARYSDLQPFARDQVGMNRVLAYQALAELDRAEEYAKQSIRDGVGLPGPWLFVRSMVGPLTGDIQGSERMAREARTRLQGTDPLGLMPMAEGIRALFAAMMGNEAMAAELVERVRSDPRGASPRTAVWADRADVWRAAHQGRTEHGVDLAVQAGHDAVAATHLVWGALAYHDAVRLGHAEKVSEQLWALAAEGRGPLVELLAAHASALAGDDPGRLESVARMCAAAGATALEAECWARRAQLCSSHARARSANRGFRLLNQCPGLRSAWFEGLQPPLSQRQDEIAALAAAGSTSKEIAQAIHLSARTVDNHLRKVYETLGLEGRHQLADLYPGIPIPHPS